MDGHRHTVTSADGTGIGLLILGSDSPAWAHEIIHDLGVALPDKTLAVLDGQGHDAIDAAPELLVTQLARFFS